VLLVENQYVIAVFDTVIHIYNASTGDLLQEEGKLDGKHANTKFKYKTAAINSQTNDISVSEIYFSAYNITEKKNTTQTEIYLMKEVTWQEQIDSLLYACRIQEAREVFLTRGNKRADNYMQRLKMFNLNAGWQLLLNTVDYA
jgi:hypothetical protein